MPNHRVKDEGYNCDSRRDTKGCVLMRRVRVRVRVHVPVLQSILDADGRDFDTFDDAYSVSTRQRKAQFRGIGLIATYAEAICEHPR